MKIQLIIAMCILSLNALGQVPTYVSTNGLAAWWPFDADANDESGNGFHGTVEGATLTSDRFGNLNSAFSFDGMNDVISSSYISIQEDYSISVWFSYDPNIVTDPVASESASGATLIQQGSQGPNWSDFSIGIRDYTGANSLVFQNQQNVDSINTVPFANSWNNLIITNSESSSFKAYLNGQLIHEMDPISLINSTENLSVGARYYSNHGWFYGSLDDIGIWDRSLTECEVQDLFNAQFNSGGSVCCENEYCYGCTYPIALNYSPEANIDDGSCMFDCDDSCLFDSNDDGAINTTDMLEFLGLFGTSCP